MLARAALALGHVTREEDDDRVQIGAREAAGPMIGAVRAGRADDLCPRRHALAKLLRKRGQRAVVHAHRAQSVPGERHSDPPRVTRSFSDGRGARDLLSNRGQPRLALARFVKAQELVAGGESRRARDQEMLDVVELEHGLALSYARPIASGPASPRTP